MTRLLDLHFDIQHTILGTWVMHFRIFTAGSATSSESNGDLILDTWTSQAVTPRNADAVDYYFSWGVSTETETPGVTDMLREALAVAFREDAIMLEGQHERMCEKPDFPMVNLPFEGGPAKMLWVLDKHLREEAALCATESA